MRCQCLNLAMKKMVLHIHDSDKQREEAKKKAEIAFFATQQNDLNDTFAEAEHIKAILDGGMPEGLPELSLDAIQPPTATEPARRNRTG